MVPPKRSWEQDYVIHEDRSQGSAHDACDFEPTNRTTSDNNTRPHKRPRSMRFEEKENQAESTFQTHVEKVRPSSPHARKVGSNQGAGIDCRGKVEVSVLVHV